jgi:transglutaminase-like putative cysteine protease
VPSKRLSSDASFFPRLQEIAVFLLILGTLALVSATEGIHWFTLLFSAFAIGLRATGRRLSTNLGCALLVAIAGAAPAYWYFFRNLGAMGIKDLLLAILMIFLLSAQTGRDFAAVSSYCLWILLASLFPSSGSQHWVLLGLLFAWFLFVQSLNELRRSREFAPAWPGREGWGAVAPLALLLFVSLTFIGVLSFGLYYLLPRNPLRAYSFQFQPLNRLVGFSNSVRLGDIGELQQDRTPAFRVRFIEGSPPILLRWRGIALADFNGVAWMNTLETWNEFRATGRISVASDEQRRLPGKRLFYEIQSLAAMDRVLFSAGVPEYVFLPEGRLRVNAEGALRQWGSDSALPAYSLAAWPGPLDGLEAHPVASDLAAEMTPERRRRYLRLPALHPKIRELAVTLTAARLLDYDKAEAVESFLRDNFSYSLQPNIGGREPLLDFLFIAKAGHCEYFSSAMAVLLRAAGVPTRVVTGFYSTLPDPVGGWYVIRSADAHSWVEVWIEGKGWLVFDPTPPGGLRDNPTQFTQWLHRMEDKLLVLSEDWMGGASGLTRPRLPDLAVDWRRLAGIVGLILCAAALVYAAIRFLARPRPTTLEAPVLLKRFLAQSRLPRQPHQTAREALAAHPAVRQAYERARFAQDPQSLAELRRLVSTTPPANP